MFCKKSCVKHFLMVLNYTLFIDKVFVYMSQYVLVVTENSL